jgi:hypothetical protein
METKYRSKIDAWIGVLLTAAVIALSWSLLEIATSGISWWSILLQTALVLALVLFILSLLLITNYTISDQSIFVRLGPFRWTIPLKEIKLIEPSRKAWSSAAMSLDRLYIDYDGSKSGIYISPIDKSRFMRDVADRASYLVYDMDRVVRTEK